MTAGKIITKDSALLEQNLFNKRQYSIFQSIEMFKVWQKTKRFEPFFAVLQNPDGEVTASLLAVIQREHDGFLGRFSSRAIIIGRPLYQSGDLNALKELLETYNRHVDNKVIYSQFRNLDKYSEEEKEIFQSLDFFYEAHLDIIHSIKKPLEAQFAAIHKGRRKNIRRAERADVEFRVVKDVPEFDKAYDLVLATYDRVKLPLPDISFFKESYQQLTQSGILKTFVSVVGEDIIGCRMVLCYGEIIYDWYAGASDKHLDKYPNDYLPWKVMEWGNLNGYKYFDFGGAGKPNVPYGVRDYKLKFGGNLSEFGRFEKVHNKLLMKIGEVGLKVYKLLR